MGTQNSSNKKDRRQYSEEFKKEAVRLSQEKGTKAAAEDLNLSPHTLSKWRKIYLDPKSPSTSEFNNALISFNSCEPLLLSIKIGMFSMS